MELQLTIELRDIIKEVAEALKLFKVYLLHSFVEYSILICQLRHSMVCYFWIWTTSLIRWIVYSKLVISGKGGHIEICYGCFCFFLSPDMSLFIEVGEVHTNII